jgi:glycosyltransferase involved in cell wall biosynthesis
MKAIVVTPYYAPKIGGLENYARALNNALADKQGWEIVIVTSQSGRRQTRDVIDGHRIYRMSTWFKLSNTPLNPLWPIIIRRIIQHEKPNVIIAHTPVPSLADATALAKGKTPFIVVNHAATLFKKGALLFNVIAWMYAVIGKYTLGRADRIFAVSDFVRERLPVTLQTKTIVVPNAVEATEIVSRSQPDGAHFIFIASLAHSHSWKGLTQIIDALAHYRSIYGSDFQLTVVGDGDMRSEYEQQASQLGLKEHVHFMGTQVGARKLELLRLATAMIVYPTTENDAFPTVILEAWSQSVPVVVAQIGSLATLLTDGVDGYFCAPGDSAALAEALHRVVVATTTERTQIAQAAAERTQRLYTWEKQAALVDQQVKDLL